jgi:class 3 adenylate cyclase
MILIALALAAQPPATAPPAPPMEISIVRDAITDRLRATATLRGDGERIEIRCESPDWGDVSVRYHSRRWLARGSVLTGRSPITIRFDDQRPIRRYWHVRDRTANFDARGTVVFFLRALMDSHQLVVRTRDVENHRFDSVFAIGETTNAITQLLQTCGSGRLNPRILPQP